MRILCLLASASLAYAANGQITFSAVNLGSGTVGNAINNSGVVVGNLLGSDGSQNPFVYANGQLTVLSITGLNGYTGAYAINDHGVIAGAGYVNANSYAQPYESFIYDHGTITHISNAGGTTTAQGINNSGVVAGGFALNYGNFFWNPFTYESGTFHDLGAFGPSWVTYGLAINDSGTVVGYHSDPNTNQRGHAFQYSEGVYSELGALPGGSTSFANAINNLGWIAGTSEVTDGNGHAFSYHDNTMVDLGTLGGGSSQAYGINDAGVVVGESQTASAPQHAFVVINGVMYDLNDSLESPLGTTLISATAINNSGQIVARGADGSSFLLSQVPEPATTTVICAAGLIVFATWRRFARR